MFCIAPASCSLRSAPSMGTHSIESVPYILLPICKLPSTISGCSAKYAFTGMPSSVCPFSIHVSLVFMGRSRFCRNMMSVPTSVPAMSLKAPIGRRIAPKSSALCAKYSLTFVSVLSIVYCDVTKATIPPGCTLSRDLAKK